MPLVWGFDSLKTLYGLFVERQIRKYLLYMHDFCSILLYGASVHILPTQTKLLCRRDIPSSCTRRYSSRRRRFRCPVRGVC